MSAAAGLRNSNLARLAGEEFDVLIVGAGINGAVSAAALATQGARVALVDRGDFAGFTSSQSSNLAWGGIKYLENYEFPLVRDLCMSRNELLRSYPSSVREIRFLTNVAEGFRHRPWQMLLGSWLYWLMGNGFTRTPRMLSREQVAREEPVVRARGLAGSIEYSDAYLYDNDSRFVFKFVRSALDRGAAAANYVESLGSERRDGMWHTQLRDVTTQRTFTLRSQVLVNAAGAFADEHNALSGQRTGHRHVYSKGVHLLVERITPNARVLAFFADDGRLFFAIPMGAKTCLGTTDTRVDDPHARVTDADRDFVLDNINARLSLERPITRADIIAERCGVRPLAVKADAARDAGHGKSDSDDFLQLSRRHAIDVNMSERHLSIFGGKLTDCINVGEEVCEQVQRLGVQLPHSGHRWYGEPEGSVREEFFHRAKLMRLDEMTAAHCSEPLSTRLWRRYGMRALALLERIRQDREQAQVMIEGTEYIRAEIEHTARDEMVVTLADFLRRRSKIALVMRPAEIREADGVMQACEVLFGENAQAQFDDYFASTAV
ncbi:MAG: glycerol-3-phosphate dehydrogenase [Gammaproteobacteria bacterium]|jgi:glycerol-3-phosphate dehydrogenase